MADNGPRIEPERNPETGYVKYWFLHDCLGEGSKYSLPRVIWTVMQEDPLTLTPSIHCTVCGVHGWMRGDRSDAALPRPL